MVPKINFGSTVLVILLVLASVVGSLQVFSPPIEAQDKKPAKHEVYFTSKYFTRQKNLVASTNTNAKIRNPFVPMHLDSNMHDSMVPNISHSQVPNASTLPVLRGILEQSGRKFAIIEYNSKSHICAIGNNVSSYTLTGLTAFSAFLEQNGQTIEIKMGRKK